MAVEQLTKRELSVYLDLNSDNKDLIEPLKQGSTDNNLTISVMRNGTRFQVPSSAKITTTVLYNVNTQGFSEVGHVINPDDSGYDITIDSGDIKIPLGETYTTTSGVCNLIIKIDDTTTGISYSYNMIYKVDETPGYKSISTADNLPTYKKVSKDIEDIKTEQTDQNNKISKNIGDITANTQSITTNTQSLTTKAQSDLSNVKVITDAEDGTIFYVKDGKFFKSPLKVNDATSKIESIYSLEVPPNTLYIGDIISFKEEGGFPSNFTQTLLKSYIFVDYENDPITGSLKPVYYKRAAKESAVVINAGNAEEIICDKPIHFGFSSYNRQVQRLGLDFKNAVTNLKLKINVNGRDCAYYPSKNAWNNDAVNGYNLSNGVQYISLVPFFATLTSYDITITFKADSTPILKGLSGKPYLVEDLNRITALNIALEDDIPSTSEIAQALNSARLLDYNSLINTPANSDTEKVEFSKIFAVKANNKTGKVIPADSFIYLESENDGTFNAVHITKAMGYKGELIGYTDEEVKDNIEGIFTLIGSVKTNVKTLSEGEPAYIGFVSGDLIDNTIAIGEQKDIAQPFGRCGVFGKSSTDGNAYAIYNAFSIISDYFGKQGGSGTTPTIANVLTEGNVANGLDIINLGEINGVTLTATGDGNSYLANDGTYKAVSSGVVGTLSQVLTQGNNAQGQDITNLGSLNGIDFVSLGDGSKFLADNGNYVEITSGSDPTLEAKVNANTKELDRIKTDISDGSKPVYVFRDRGIPTESELTSKDYKAYYIHCTVLRTNQSLQLPQGKADDTIFCLENNDRADTIILTTSSGETVNGVSSFTCGYDTLNFFIKKGTDWKQAFGGVFPNSLTSLRTTIQSLLSTQLHTMDEIEAQLKSMGFMRDIQNYLQKYLRTDDQLESLITSFGFSKGFSVGYGLLTDQTVPNDKTWIQAYISPNQEILIPKTSGSKYVGIYMPVFFEPLVSEVKINNAIVETTTKEIVINELRFAVLVTNTPVDASQNIRLQIVFSDSLANVTKGIIIDDGTTDKAGIKKINIQGAYLSKVFDDSDEVTLNCVTSFETLDGMGGGKANRVLTEAPLLTYLDPDVKPGEEPRVKMYLQHDYFELKKPPGYLAYLSENEEIIGRITPGETGVRSGTIWFDDVVVGNDGFLEVDKPNKAIGIQDYTEDDPNITGGIPTLIAFRAVMKGQAPNDGFVELILKKTDEGTPTQDGSLLLNANGNPIGATREYKAGQDLGKLEAMAIYMAKGLTKFQCILKHSFVDDGVMLEDRTEGASGLCIQALGKEYATGDALLQFENDTMQNIEMSKHYNGEDIFNIAWVLGYDRADVDINVGNGETTVDGLHFYNNTNLKVGVANKTIHIHDNGTDMAYFSLGQIFSAEKTLMLRNKDLDVKVTLQDKRDAYRIYMVKWTGTPDAYTKKVIDHYDPDSGAIPETNWVLDGSVFISEDVVSGEHDFQGVLTVPSDANNFAVVIVPVTKQTPIDLYMKAFEINVSEPFYGWILEAPELVNEKHLQFSERHKELRCDVKGFSQIRYTLNNVPAGMPMPIGVLGDGKADIEIDHTINQVSGSQLPQFEGAIKFLKDGEATIETELYIRSEKSHGTLSVTKFWYSKVSSNGLTFTKIPLSEYTVSVRGQTKAVNKMPRFKITVEAGDRIALFGTSDQADGAYLDQIAGDPTPMLKTTIDFDEITEAESDLLDKITSIDNEIVFTKEAIDNGVYLEIGYDIDKKQPTVTAKTK